MERNRNKYFLFIIKYDNYYFPGDMSRGFNPFDITIDDVMEEASQHGLHSTADMAELRKMFTTPDSQRHMVEIQESLMGKTGQEMKQMCEDMMGNMAHLAYKTNKNRDKVRTAKEEAQPRPPSDVKEAELASEFARFRKEVTLGKFYVVCHLKDKTGKALNGERCKTVAFDVDNPWNGRYHCEILSGDKKGRLFRIKYANLIDGDGSVLTRILQPTPPDLMDPRDFLVNMIIAWTSSQRGVPPAPIEDYLFDRWDSLYRGLIVARYIAHHAGIGKYENFTDKNLDFRSIPEEADLVGLVNRLHKRDPKFFTNDFSAYWLLDLRAKRFPEKAHKAEAHLLKKGGFTNVKKNKKRLVEALTLALQYLIVDLNQNPRTMQSRKMKDNEVRAVDYHNNILTVVQRLDVATPALECGRLTANTFPETMKKLESAKLGHDNNYMKLYSSMQAGCCGDQAVDFRRFNFGLTGGSNLPPCSICIEPLEGGDLKVAKLDCQHIFHEDCIAEWFQDGRRDCPSCKVVHVGLACYHLSDHLQERFVRYIASGECERCQSLGWEKKHRDFLEKDAFRNLNWD